MIYSLLVLVLTAPVPVGEPVALPNGPGCTGAAPTRATTAAAGLGFVAPQRMWPLTRGEGVVVAVVDSGVDATTAVGSSVLPGVDVVSGGRADTDCRGRGTALAAIVAARPAPDDPAPGVAPAVTVFPVRVTDPQGRVTAPALAAGITAAVGAGARVILVGPGAGQGAAAGGPVEAVQAAVEAAEAAGALIVAPVNGGPGGAWLPAVFEPVLAVGSAGDPGRAAGADVRAAGADVRAPDTAFVRVGSGDGHYSVRGTAVAAAYVAGTVALLRAFRPGLSPAQVRARIGTTGAGVLDPYAAVTAVAPAEPTVLPGRPGPVALPTRAPEPPPVARVTGLLVALSGIAFGVLVTAAMRRRRRPPSG